MPQPLLTSPDDVETAILRPFTSTEQQYLAPLIGQASALLRQAAPSIDARIARYTANPLDPSAVSPATVAAVLAQVVKRYLINPAGIASETHGTGPFTDAVAYALRSQKEPLGVLRITDLDLAVLFPSRKRLRAGSIRLRAGLAPRPVGRYGPLPLDIGRAVEAVVTFGDPNETVLNSSDGRLLVIPPAAS